MTRKQLLLEQPESWPSELLAVLQNHHELFIDWEEGRATGRAKAYDRAIYDVAEHLQPYSVLGWHCTRLTINEIDKILADGIQMPNAEILRRRIDDCVMEKFLTPEIATTLRAKNQAQESNRAGIFWFCFFHPKQAGEAGISRFFRHWGGEALYNFHEDDPVTSKALRAFGTPCLVEADVPIVFFKSAIPIAFNVVGRFLAGEGLRTDEPVEFESCINQDLPSEAIRAVIQFPAEKFLALTGCAAWRVNLITESVAT